MILGYLPMKMMGMPVGVPELTNHVSGAQAVFDVELDCPLPILVRVHDLNPPIVFDWYGLSSAPPGG